MKHTLLFTLLLGTTFLFAQTGPGGVGNSDGSNSQPENLVWLDASDLSLSDGASVTSWTDKSGNANNFGQLSTYNVPVFSTSGLASGSHDVVRFDGTERYLSLSDNSTLNSLSQVSLIVVFKPSVLSGARGIIAKRAGSSSQNEYTLFTYTSNYLYFDIQTTSGSNDRSNTSSAVAVNTDYVASAIYDGSSKEIFLQSVQSGSTVSKSGTIYNGTAPLILGALNQGYGTYFSGDVAEVLVYGYGLNTAQRLIVENYLSEKYGITVTNDFYTGYSGSYNEEVAGIGKSNSESHTLASSAGFMMSAYDGSFDNGDFVLAGHSATTNSIVSTSLTGSVVERWNRDWYVDVTGTLNAAIGFDFGDGIGGQYPQSTTDYRLLKWNGSAYEEVTTVSTYVSDDQLYFNVENPTDGYYTLGTVDSSTSPLDGDSPRTWYAYKSGNWGDPTSWTLDGAVSALYVNPDSEYPTSGDLVVIKSGRTIQMLSSDGTTDFNNASVKGMDIIGTLNLGTSYGHSFTTITGTGKMILEGSSADDTDNLPSGDWSDFSSTSGGTVELQGDGLTIDTESTFNQFVVNLDAGASAVLLTDLTINGNFSVNGGTFQINNSSATTALTIDLYGDLIVDSDGAIATGTANARHQFNFYGDFTNEGTVAFTQRTTQTTSTEATNGIVDANFLNDTEDQSILCSNTTYFYRIEIDKGEDDSYTLNIDSEDAAYFNLLGYAAQAHGDVAQLTSNTNALGLLKGTVRIGDNVTIASLNTGSNYNISEAAKLWIDGGSVTKSVGTAIVPYGGILVTDGTLVSSVSSGITTRGNGSLEVTGGKVQVNQFRTSIYGSDNQGGYSQSGGEVYVTATSTSTDYYPFSLTYEGNTFAMTGGILTVNPNTKGGIFINGSDGNFQVEGGEIVCEIQENYNFKITSRAPFYNLTFRKISAANRYFILDGGSTTSGTDDVTLTAQPLVVLNDMKILNSTDSYTDFTGATTTPGYNSTFKANNVDISIEGNLEISDGSTFTPGYNTVTFNGSGVSYLEMGTSVTQVFNNLTIAKDKFNEGLVIESGNSTAAIEIDSVLTVTLGKFSYASFIAEAKGNIVLYDTIGLSEDTGKLLMNGSSAQTITTDDEQVIYNLEIDNASGISQTGDLSILGTLTLTDGVFDINTYRLTCVNAVETTGTFGADLMIQTAGNASDDGLTLYVDALGTYFYPIGTDANSDTRYTPVSVTLDSYYDDGYMALSIGDRELSTLSSSGSALSYYWQTDYSDFSTVPLLSGIDFTYSNDDTGTGAQLTASDAFVPGVVLNSLPYTRLAMTDVIDGTNTFTFDSLGNAFHLKNANYTAGTTDKFDGSIRIFYANRNSYVWNANWTDPTMWSSVEDYTSTYNEYGEAPGENDIAVISYETTYAKTNTRNRRNINIDGDSIVVAGLVLERDTEDDDCTYCQGILTLSEDTETHLNVTGSISGNGVMQYQRNHFNNSQGAALTFGDIGEFVTNDEAIWIMRMDGEYDTKVDYITDRFPNLYVNGDGGNYDYKATSSGEAQGLIFLTDITCNTLNISNFGALKLDTAAGNITVIDSLYLGSAASGGTAGRIIFREKGTAREINVGGNLILGYGYHQNSASFEKIYETSEIVVVDGGTLGLEHEIQVGGNLIIYNQDGMSDPVLDLYSDLSGGANVILKLTGDGEKYFQNRSDSIPDLYRIIMDKGDDTTSVFTFENEFVLNGSTDDADSDDKALVLENGKLVFDHANIDVLLTSGGDDFNIPATSGLEVTQGEVSVTGDDVGIYLNGLLRINGGTVNLDDDSSNGNNYVEYSSSGSAALEISSGSLIVGSQIRRGLNSTSGILAYKQSGGTVILGQNAAPETTRGVFEVSNSSSFTHTGGSFTLVRGVSSTSVASLLMSPSSYELTGSEITIGNADTPSGSASSSIGLKVSIPLNDLTIVNSSGSNPTVLLYSVPLTVEGTLTNPASATFNANGYDLVLEGDFVNNGTYTPSSNTTYFSKDSGTQAFSGTGTSEFYNFVKEDGGTLTIAQDITIDNAFTVSAGELALESYTAYISGDATVQSTVSSSGGYGLYFYGSDEQELIGLANEEVIIDILTIDNENGVVIEDGNGYLFTIDGTLRMAEGVFDVGGSLLTIGEDGSIEEVTSFSEENMIQTNSSYSDNGLKKIFSGSETEFTFPVGDSQYTPMMMSMTAIDAGSYITVRPANEMHPAVTDDASTSEDETENVLQYYWVIKSSGLTSSVDGNILFYYDQSDVEYTSPYTESDYIPARLITDSEDWDKTFVDGGWVVDPVNNTIAFPLVETASFSGDYTAGIDNAFREVPIYRSTDGVVFSLADGWEVYDSDLDTWDDATTRPVGAKVIIQDGHTATVDLADVRLLSTTIGDGSYLVIEDGYYNIRLGDVDSTGTLVLSNEVLPSGSYDEFFTCTGGALEYTSSNSYSVLSGISNVRSVSFTGTGTRTMPSNEVTICEGLVIDGPTVVKDNSYDLVVSGDFTLTSGTMKFSSADANLTVGGTTTLTAGSFTGYSGAAITFNGDVAKADAVTFTGNSAAFKMAGSDVQDVTGSFSMKYLTVKNTGSGIDLTSGGNLTISQTLTMTDGLITSSSSYKVTFTSTGTYSGASSASYFNGPVTKNSIASSATYTFPVGKDGRYAPVSISNVATGSQNWTAEYFTNIVDSSIPTTSAFDTSDPGSGLNALNEIKTTDRWSVTSSGSNTAYVKVTYGSHDSYTSANSIRIIWWDASQSRWENVGDVVSGTYASGTVQSSSAMHFSSQQFGLGNAPESTLPVEFASFTGELTSDGNVLLEWETASEIDNDYFEIQRLSKDGSEFEKIGEVAGAGTSTELLDYEFVDEDPLYGNNYYRLMQVDYDGNSEYSDIIVVNNDSDETEFGVSVYPNPTSADNIQFMLQTGDEVTPVHVQLIDLVGAIHFAKSYQPEVGQQQYQIVPKTETARGIYILVIRQGAHVEKVKLIIK